jgi:heme A synthase
VSTSAQDRCARFAWAVLAYNLAVVLWGAYVRATGAGAGCGNHWPLCNGEVIPLHPAVKTMVEYSHRLSSGLAGVLVLGLLVWAAMAFPKGHPARLGAALAFLFVMVEGLLGAGLVLLQHVAKNASIARAYSLSAHLINTLVLIACLTLAAWWSSGGARVRLRGAALWSALASLAVLILMGVSGALAALGDTLFPPASLAEALRQDFAPSVHLFVRLRVLHPFIAVAGGGWLLYSAISLTVQKTAGLPRALPLWAGALVAVQIAAGLVNVLLLAPVWMQLVHLLLADLLWIAWVLIAACRLAEERA